MLNRQSRIHALRFVPSPGSPEVTVFCPAVAARQEMRRKLRARFGLRYADIVVEEYIVSLTKVGFCNLVNTASGVTPEALGLTDAQSTE